MTDFTMAACDVSVEIVGGDYINFGGELASFKPSVEATFAEEIVFDQVFPHYTLTGLTGGIEITGLRTGAASDELYSELHVDERRQAFFAVMHKNAKMLGPAGYVMLNKGDIMDSDGIFKLDGAGAAMPGDGFEEWRFGTILPRTLNQYRNQGSNGFPAPVGNQMAVINVIKPGGLTALSVQLNKSSDTYTLAAKEKSNRPVAGLTRGYLQKSDNSRVPSTGLTGYRWRIATTGTATNAVFYIALIHLFD